MLVTIDREVEASTGTLQLQALFPNPNNVLRPGAFGRILVPRDGGPRRVLVVPAQAVRESQGRASVAVVDASGVVHARQVSLGGEEAGGRVVTDGLQEGERVVVEGGQKVRDGAQVDASPYVAPAAAAATAHSATPAPSAAAGPARP